MPDIALPTGLNGLTASPKTREETKNLFVTRGQNPALSIRPGIDLIDTTFGSCRGMGLFRNDVSGDEELYGVFGTRLVRITVTNVLARKELSSDDILIENLGEIPGTSVIRFTAGFTKLLILQVGGLAWEFNQAFGLVLISSNPNFLPSVTATYDSGRFVYCPLDGSPNFWSELDEPGDILASSFFDAEIFPDPTKANYAQKSSVYVLGSRSIQRFNYNPNRDTYDTYKGEESTIGYVGGLTRYGETFAFVGNGSEGDFNIYVMNGQPQAISNDYVSELINNEYSLPDLENMTAESFEWKGSLMAVFYFPRHTLVYYGGWSFWQSGVAGSKVLPWRINNIAYAYGYLWTGDDTDGSLGVMRDSGNEYGNDIEWMIKTYIKTLPETNFVVNRVVATATMGAVATTEESLPQIGLGVSLDGRIPGQPIYLNLGRAGDYNLNLRWGAPIAKGYDHVGLEFLGKGNAVMNMDGIYFE